MNHTGLAKPLFILAFVAALPSLDAERRAIDRLADKADAVVVGEVRSGQQTGTSVAFVLSVARTLKGDLRPGGAVSVSWVSPLKANKDLKGKYGLWFLRKASGTDWALQRVREGWVPLEFAYFPLPKGSTGASFITASRPVTVHDLLAVELTAGLQFCTDRSQCHDLAVALFDIGESTVTPELYRALRASGDTELRFLGLAGLLRSNYGSADISALAEIASNVDLIPGLEMRGFVLSAIEARRDSDPDVIRYLGIIASSPDVSVQRSVAWALKFIHTRDTLPILGRLLDSTDSGTRESAMTGFSRYVDNLPVATVYNTLNGKWLIPQGPAPYGTPETDTYSLSTRRLDQTREAEFLQFWRSWWATMRDRVMAAPGAPIARPAP